MSGYRLLDERTSPSLRDTIGGLLVRSTRVDLAVTRIRLGMLDLSQAEVEGPQLCRVLVGQLDASTLLDAAPVGGFDPKGPSAAGLRRLREWLDSDRLQVRSAGIGSWTPDFSVFSSRHGSTTALLGAHYFGEPQLTVGPSLTAILSGPEIGRQLRVRFEELWGRGHEVGPAIAEILEAAGDRAGVDVGRRP